jgi:Na+-driven multidrug efflux pump
MRKAAVRAFVVALVMNVGLTAFHLVATNWKEAAGGSGLATVIVSWVVSIGVLLYAKKLERRGVLT